MDLLLDMKTILILLVIGHLFTVLLISTYWRSHTKDSTLNVFFLAKCVQAVAWLLLTLRGGISDVFTISIANSLLFIGEAIESYVIYKFVCGYQRSIKKLYIGLTIVFLVSFHLIILFYNFEHIRIFCASFGSAILAILPAYRLMREKSSTLLMRFIGLLYYLVALSLLLRCAAAIVSNQQMGLFTPGLTQTISFLCVYLVMIIGNTGFILILKEKTDAELMHMAYYDELTQTLNRRTFVYRAKQALSQCSKEKKLISFILFDVDNFKNFNDSYGHDAGDRILQDLSKRIHQLLDSHDLFGRYGGDEFAILLTGLDEQESVKKLEQMKVLIGEAELTGIPEKYFISMGIINLVPDKQTKLENLYVSCDKALYEAKGKGKNCIISGKLKEMQLQY